jgi:hypothetical protein
LAIDALTPPPQPVSLPEIAANPAALRAMTQEHAVAAVRRLRLFQRGGVEPRPLWDLLESDLGGVNASVRGLLAHMV